MGWGIKAFSDLYELAREDIDNNCLVLFPKDCTCEFEFGDFLCMSSKNNKSQLSTYLGNNVFRYASLG